MKLLFTILIVYFAYKILFPPKKIEPPKDNASEPKTSSDEEYIDFEELDD